jgi:predicted hydrocarbon binding protein
MLAWHANNNNAPHRRIIPWVEAVMNTSENMQRVQGLMMFLGALADGLESVTGRGAEAVCFRSGRVVGLKRDIPKKEQAIFNTLEAVRQEMRDMDINWPFELYKKESVSDFVIPHEGYRELWLPFRNCIVRCTLFRYGFPQGKALCQTKHGLFSGLFDNIYGTRSHLGIVHAGENACLLNLKIYD